MARLNEPPAAPAAAIASTGESADALRRRFIRQNRELAKNNSSQSLRIRTLELEVSRLLADNLELSNQVLRLRNEAYTAQRKADRSLKVVLRTKIEALIDIVDGMEDEDTQPPPTEKKPLEGNWRERQPLSELMRDSQMPTIQEDKQYPRRTLGADEIQAIRLSDHSSNESPDLGPPPIAHFDDDNAGDPVKNASPLGNKVTLPPSDTREDEEDLPASLSVNLETRRKRKDGQPRIEVRRRSLMPPQSPEKEAEQPSAILRTGAKRKLADRETEKPIRPPVKGDFTFSRKVSGEDAKHSALSDQTDAEPKLDERSTRKVLGDKSVNMSPRKTTAAAVSEKPEKDKPVKSVASRFQSANREKDREKEKEKDATISSRRRRTSAIPLPSPPRDERPILETVEIAPPPDSGLPTSDIHPKTPLPPDLFSPTPSEPSAARPEARTGTPPPGDLSTLSNTTDGGARPSRRARAAVNYAEPSLNAKMRRPGKQMVDAISGLQHHSRAMSAGTGTRESGGSIVRIKSEPVEEEGLGEAWKALPPAVIGSPLGGKGGAVPGGDGNGLQDPARPPSAPPKASFLANSRKRRESAQQAAPADLETAVRKMEELDLYDFKESSSPSTDSSGGHADDARMGKTGASKGHRRHSSVPRASEAPVEAGGERVVKSTAMGSVRAASRRKSMML